MDKISLKLTHFAILMLGIFVTSGCGQVKPAPQAPPPPAVTVTSPVAYPVKEYYDYNGYLDAVETVQIRARVKGFLNKIEFKEGDLVKKGQLLYQIDRREYVASRLKTEADIAKATADMANASAQILFAEADLRRVKQANAAGAGAQTDLDKAIATLAANNAQLEVAKANKAAAEAARDAALLDLEYTDIKAPITGRISRTLVTQGNLVGQNETTLLTTIVSIDPIYVYFDVPEKELVNYRRSSKGRMNESDSEIVPIEVGVANELGYPHLGQIDFRENKVDTGTGTIRIRGVLKVHEANVPPDQAPVLYPGLYARVRVSAGPAKSLLVVPEDALMTGPDGRFVYVVGADKIVHRRVVEVGPTVWRSPPPGTNAAPGQEWSLIDSATKKSSQPVPMVRSIIAIKKGIESSDGVIISGLQRARPDAPVEPEPLDLKAPSQNK